MVSPEAVSPTAWEALKQLLCEVRERLEGDVVTAWRDAADLFE